MSRRRDTRDKRCPRCRINKRWCFCDHLNPIHIDSFLTVIMHRKETMLTSNTSSLALNMIENSELYVRGEEGVEFDFSPKEDYQPLYLFPSEDSQVLTADYIKQFDKPIQLVVPDSTWRQAKKFHKREPSLASIPRVRVEGNLRNIYTLRKSPVEGGVCTLEAIALAMGVIEGQKVQEQLLEALTVMNQRVEMSRDPKLWNLN